MGWWKDQPPSTPETQQGPLRRGPLGQVGVPAAPSLTPCPGSPASHLLPWASPDAPSVRLGERTANKALCDLLSAVLTKLISLGPEAKKGPQENSRNHLCIPAPQLLSRAQCPWTLGPDSWEDPQVLSQSRSPNPPAAQPLPRDAPPSLPCRKWTQPSGQHLLRCPKESSGEARRGLLSQDKDTRRDPTTRPRAREAPLESLQPPWARLQTLQRNSEQQGLPSLGHSTPRLNSTPRKAAGGYPHLTKEETVGEGATERNRT